MRSHPSRSGRSALSRRILEVLQPEKFQIALRAVNELQERSETIDRQWRMRIERFDYQAQLAQRRYEEVDPSHRLVAATLEQRWNQALEEAQRNSREASLLYLNQLPEETRRSHPRLPMERRPGEVPQAHQYGLHFLLFLGPS
jgi:hypothetical protein